MGDLRFNFKNEYILVLETHILDLVTHTFVYIILVASAALSEWISITNSRLFMSVRCSLDFQNVD